MKNYMCYHCKQLQHKGIERYSCMILKFTILDQDLIKEL